MLYIWIFLVKHFMLGYAPDFIMFPPGMVLSTQILYHFSINLNDGSNICQLYYNKLEYFNDNIKQIYWNKQEVISYESNEIKIIIHHYKRRLNLLIWCQWWKHCFMHKKDEDSTIRSIIIKKLCQKMIDMKLCRNYILVRNENCVYYFSVNDDAIIKYESNERFVDMHYFFNHFVSLTQSGEVYEFRKK